MSKAKELRDKFKTDLKELQDNCPHKEIEKMPYSRVPGHNYGDCLICLECDKILETYPVFPLTVTRETANSYLFKKR